MAFKKQRMGRKKSFVTSLRTKLRKSTTKT